MKIGIKAAEIMNENFLIFDSSLTIEECIRKMSKDEIVVVIKDGFFHSVLNYFELIRIFFERKKMNLTLGEVEGNKNYAVISPEADLEEVIELMKDKDFLIVKERNYVGIITKQELTEVQPFIFEKLIFEKIQPKII